MVLAAPTLLLPPLDGGPARPPGPDLATFHPAVAAWFMRRFPDGPTEPRPAAGH